MPSPLSADSSDRMQPALFSVGSNSHGQLGQGTLDDASTFQRTTFPPACGRVLEMAFGGTHTLALCSVHGHKELFVAGSNARGQLGPGEPSSRLTFEHLSLELLLAALPDLDCERLESKQYVVEEIAASWETSFVHLRSEEQGGSDVLLSMGANDWDELGVGPQAGEAGRLAQQFRCRLVDFSHLTPSPSPTTPPALRLLSIKAGPRHVVTHISLRSTFPDGHEHEERLFVGWGAARHGQLGNPSTTSRPPRTHPLPTPFAIPSLSSLSVIEYDVGRDHTAFLFPSGHSTTCPLHVLLLGSAKQGQLGPSLLTPSHGVLQPPLPLPAVEHSKDNQLSLSRIACTWSGTYLLSSSLTDPLATTLHAFGSNAHSQLGLPSSLPSSSTPLFIPLLTSPFHDRRAIEKLACGSEHVLVLSSVDGGAKEVWGWGWNEHGNLGDGSTTNVERPLRIWPPLELGQATNVWAGNATSWILVSVSS